MRGTLVVAGALAVSQAALGVAAWRQATVNHTVYVMTPMVDVVPGGNPLDRSEAQALVADVRHQAEARDMQSAYAWLGSTLSLDDLLRGIEALDAAGHPLDADQASAIRALLDGAKADHERIYKVQVDALAAEDTIQAEIAAIAALLPPGQAQQVLQAARPGPAKPPGRRP